MFQFNFIVLVRVLLYYYFLSHPMWKSSESVFVSEVAVAVELALHYLLEASSPVGLLCVVRSGG